MGKPLETISDLAALARSGFKAEQIMELIKNKEDSTDETPGVDDKEQDETSPKKDEPPKPDGTETDEDSVDYKSEFEKLSKELESVKADLKKAQEFNKRKDVSGNAAPTGEEALNNLFREIL